MKNNKGLFTKDWWRSLFLPVGGNEPRMLTFYKKDATKSVISSLLCILGGILIGFIFMLIMAAASDEITVASAFQGLGIIFQGPFASGSAKYVNTNFGNMLFKSVPIIMTGLSVAIAFKTGLFNIGASGQFLMASMGAMLVALNIDCSGNPAAGFFVWILAVLVGTAFAMIWGAIPGLFRALFNVNEVIVCIMTNWIAGNLISWVFTNTPDLINKSAGKTNFLVTTATTGTGTPTIGLNQIFKGSTIDLSFILAIVIAIVVFIVLTRTTFGFELRACGANRYGAKYAGM
ncbi:MAG: ABC transporter permease, partial [Clostridia bacterium]|nr:ABC transporter permease [Clostridia bacterium]